MIPGGKKIRNYLKNPLIQATKSHQNFLLDKQHNRYVHLWSELHIQTDAYSITVLNQKQKHKTFGVFHWKIEIEQ